MYVYSKHKIYWSRIIEAVLPGTTAFRTKSPPSSTLKDFASLEIFGFSRFTLVSTLTSTALKHEKRCNTFESWEKLVLRVALLCLTAAARRLQCVRSGIIRSTVVYRECELGFVAVAVNANSFVLQRKCIDETMLRHFFRVQIFLQLLENLFRSQFLSILQVNHIAVGQTLKARKFDKSVVIQWSLKCYR